MTHIISPTPAALSYLSSRDKRMAALIDRVGPLSRSGNPDVFSAVIRHIIGQQISTSAQATVYARLQALVPAITAESILALSQDELKSIGISYRKEDYIRSFADAVHTGAFDPDSLHALSDAEAIAFLSSLKGIGVWTAEMLLIFTLNRPDVLSFGDLGIRRGLMMLYRHKEIPKERFLRYQKRFSPYGTTASLYLWELAGGKVEGF